MKIRDLDKNTFNQLIDLECENIIPILASVGINLNREQMVSELNSFQEDQVTLFKLLDTVEGFMIYRVNEKGILIKTFNLKSFNNKIVLVGLLSKIAEDFKQVHSDIVISHCHLTNQKSLNLHKGLGFYEIKKSDKHIEFHIKRSDMIDNITKRVGRIKKLLN